MNEKHGRAFAPRLGPPVWPQPWEVLRSKLAPQVEPASHRSSKHLSPSCSVSAWPHLPVGKECQMLKERCCLLAPFLKTPHLLSLPAVCSLFSPLPVLPKSQPSRTVCRAAGVLRKPLTKRDLGWQGGLEVAAGHKQAPSSSLACFCSSQPGESAAQGHTQGSHSGLSFLLL